MEKDRVQIKWKYHSTIYAGILPLVAMVSWLIFCLMNCTYNDGKTITVEEPNLISNKWPESVQEYWKNKTGLERDIDEVSLLQIQNQSRKNRRLANRCFMECLMLVHHNKAEALIWLKENVKSSTCKIIIKDYNFDNTRLEKIQDVIEDMKTKASRYLSDKLRRMNKSRVIKLN